MAQASSTRFEEKPMASTNSYPGLQPRIVALVRHHAGRLASPDCRLEREDMEQELLAHLHARACSLDPARASQATFQDRVVRHRAADLARNARAAKRGHSTDTMSFDELIQERDEDEAHREAVQDKAMSTSALEVAVSLRLDLARFLSAQPRHLQDCCLLLLRHSVTETARVLGHHRSTVYAWLALLRERARAAGLDIYLSTDPTESVPAE
jgi:hypothetical protein